MKHTSYTAHSLGRGIRSLGTTISLFLITAVGVTAFAGDNIKLQVALKGEHNDPGGKSPEEVNNRWLEIAATAFSLEKPSEVRLEWALYGDNLESDKVVKQGEGTASVALEKSKKADVKTKTVTFNFTPRHSVRSGSGRRVVFKKVEATGVRYHGWGVRAFVDGKLVGESYSSVDIQRRMSGESS